MLSFIVSCALPESVTVFATAANGTVYEFFGELGLASEWLDHRFAKRSRGWSNRVSLRRWSTITSWRSPSRCADGTGVAVSSAEAAAHTLEEGAFYGDYL